MIDCAHEKLTLPTDEYRIRLMEELESGLSRTYCTKTGRLFVDVQDDEGEFNGIAELCEVEEPPLARSAIIA